MVWKCEKVSRTCHPFCHNPDVISIRAVNSTKRSKNSALTLLARNFKFSFPQGSCTPSDIILRPRIVLKNEHSGRGEHAAGFTLCFLCMSLRQSVRVEMHCPTDGRPACASAGIPSSMGTSPNNNLARAIKHPRLLIAHNTQRL